MREARLGVAFLGLHPDRRRDLVARYGSPAALLAAARRGSIDGIDPSRITTASGRRYALAAAGVRVVVRGDPDYPEPLDGIADPPDVLFARGQIPRGPVVAIVGTRRATGYGRGLARAFGRSAAAAGWVVCSGLARGIDGEAHRGALQSGGPGIGVLGCGSDVAYPREHAGLVVALEATGAVITEYPPGTAPHGWRFPPRNRIIAGLSRAVVVVEAGATGGALVTAARAVEQGREVFAVPGDVDRESSVGCNLLIRDGAIPVLGADDLVAALSVVLGAPSRRRAEPAPVPPSGISTDDLGRRLGLDGAGLLAWLGRAQLSGEVRVEGDRVYPGR